MAESNLEDSKVDFGVALTKSVVGVIPFAGPAISELVTTLIPNQRLDRVTGFIVELENRVEEIEQASLNSNKYFIDLFEDALIQATKSLSEDRNKYIAIFLANNKNINDNDFSIKKKILHMLAEVTDTDIDILKTFNDRRAGWRKQEQYKPSRPMTMKELDNLEDSGNYKKLLKVSSWDAHINTLVKLSLIKAKHKTPPEDLDPDYNQQYIDEGTGLAEIEGYRISNLGKLFLSSIEDRNIY